MKINGFLSGQSIEEQEYVQQGKRILQEGWGMWYGQNRYWKFRKWTDEDYNKDYSFSFFNQDKNIDDPNCMESIYVRKPSG